MKKEAFWATIFLAACGDSQPSTSPEKLEPCQQEARSILLNAFENVYALEHRGSSAENFIKQYHEEYSDCEGGLVSVELTVRLFQNAVSTGSNRILLISLTENRVVRDEELFSDTKEF